MQLSRPALVLLAIATVIVGTSAPGAAVPWNGADVDTDPAGAHVEFRGGNTWIDVGPRRPSGGGSTGSGCQREWKLSPGAFALRRTRTGDYRQVDMEPAPGDGYDVYHVWCDDVYVTSVWLRPEQFGVNPRAIAERLVHDLPYPAATVGANPSGRGLTGLESWFWVDGYTGAPIVDTVTELGITVTVEATPTTVGWDFGDGTPTSGLGVGAAPPAAPTVTHVYERRGQPTHRVRALIELAVRWRQGDGPWASLAPVMRTAILDYPVASSRAALVPDR